MTENQLIPAWRTAKAILSIISIIRIFAPSLQIYTEEELIMGFLDAFDLCLIPWIVCIWALGAQLRKIRKYPIWLPSIPVTLIIVSFWICTAFGFAATKVNGLDDTLKVVIRYGIGNGALISVIEIAAYTVQDKFCDKGLGKTIKNFFNGLFEKKEVEK